VCESARQKGVVLLTPDIENGVNEGGGGGVVSPPVVKIEGDEGGGLSLLLLSKLRETKLEEGLLSKSRETKVEEGSSLLTSKSG